MLLCPVLHALLVTRRGASGFGGCNPISGSEGPRGAGALRGFWQSLLLGLQEGPRHQGFPRLENRVLEHSQCPADPRCTPFGVPVLILWGRGSTWDRGHGVLGHVLAENHSTGLSPGDTILADGGPVSASAQTSLWAGSQGSPWGRGGWLGPGELLSAAS